MREKRKLKEWIFVALVVLIGTLVVFFGARRITRMIQEDCLDKVGENAEHVSKSFSDKLSQAQDDFELFVNVAVPRIDEDENETDAVLMQFVDEQIYSGVCILWEDGNTVSRGDVPEDISWYDSFDSEAKKVPYTSDKISDGELRKDQYIYQAVPIERMGQVVAVAYGFINLDTLPTYVDTELYGGNAQVLIMDAATGEFLVDEYHRYDESGEESPLMNSSLIGKREIVSGGTWEEITADIQALNSGYWAFVSERTGNIYYTTYHPIGINSWVISITIDEPTAFGEYFQVQRVIAIMAIIVFSLVLLIVLVILFHLFNNKKEQDRLLEEQQKKDALTGLINRKTFFDEAERFLRYVAPEEISQYWLIYTNIRDFRLYNVEYGIHAGDEILKFLAKELDGFDANILCGRMEQDHFLILAKTTQDVYVENTEIINRLFDTKYGRYGLSFASGAYQLQSVNEDIHASKEFAKLACDSIRNTSNPYSVYNDKLAKSVEISGYILQHFDEAIEKNYIQVYFQPVLRTINGEMCGVEALARWIDPERGMLSPADFIPILESHGLITRLDLHMLKLICDEIRNAYQHGHTIIPVSFNLSRLDFKNCDIVEEVDQIIFPYHIPRDMINVEITESTIMADQEFMKSEIRRFRERGYQVWMDDFGSGYSSLNVLKEYEFDEVKLDMAFLSTFDEKSKHIIKSVVRMSKELGIQTLAEGVETEEQFEFLKRIGCEKIQGYYLSRPVPPDDFFEMVEYKKIVLERRRWRNFYSRIGAADMMTDKSLCIVEYDGKEFQYIYINEACENVWRSLGAKNMDTIYTNVNSNNSPLAKQFRELQENLHVGDGYKEIIYSVRGQYVRLTARCLAEQEERAAYEVELVRVTNEDEDAKRQRMDTVFRMMFSLYDSIFLLNLETGSFETILQGAFSSAPESRKFIEGKKIDPELATAAYIHPGDQKKYQRFTNQDTLIERLQNANQGYLVEYFRTRTHNGSYVWKAHSMLYISDLNQIIYSVRHIPEQKFGMLKNYATDDISEDIEKELEFDHAVETTLQESQTINIFWKDKNRRFVGANQKFMDSYGFKELSDFVGKTDEEMGWHVDNLPFREAELEVLNQGKVIENQLGVCIIKGVAHRVLATKEPVFKDGKIIGLVGCFIDAEEIVKRIGVGEHFNLIDTPTGVLSIQGLTNILSEYLDTYLAQKKNFAVIRVTLDAYRRAVESYGLRAAQKMRAEFAKILTETVGNRGNCARIYSGNFSILMQYEEKADVEELRNRLEDTISNTHKLAGYAATLNTTYETFYSEDTSNPEDMFGYATSTNIMDAYEKSALEFELNFSNDRLEVLVDAIPGGVMLQEVLPDGRLHPIYISAQAKTITGRTREEFEEDLLNPNDGILEEDVLRVRKTIEDAVQTREMFDVNYRLDPVGDEEPIELNMKGKYVGESDGNPVILVLYQRV